MNKNTLKKTKKSNKTNKQMVWNLLFLFCLLLLLLYFVCYATLPVIDELIGERIAWLALHDIGLGSLVGQRDGRHLSVREHRTREIHSLFFSLICPFFCFSLSRRKQKLSNKLAVIGFLFHLILAQPVREVSLLLPPTNGPISSILLCVQIETFSLPKKGMFLTYLSEARVKFIVLVGYLTLFFVF